MKKVWITGLIVLCFFMATITSVNATDEVKYFIDKTGDVFYYGGDESETFPEVTDIDMHYITYTQENGQVTLEIEFVDIIEESKELIISISLSTSEEEYEIGYWFGETTGYYGDSKNLGGITITGFGSNKLSFNFNLINDDEDYESLLIMTQKYSETEDYSYADMFPDLGDLPDVNIQGPEEGTVGESIQFYATVSGGTPPYSYNWDFDGDGETDSTKQNPTYTFSEPGEYEVWLEVSDGIGIPGGNYSYISISGILQPVYAPSDNVIAVFDTTMGTFAVELFVDIVPITTENFIDLANQGYYNQVIFHRVIEGFMIQGGDPTGTGMGGHAAEYHEGYEDPNNPDTWVIPDEFHDDLKHDSAGVLSMANSGSNTGGSQFFITVASTPWLDGKHAVFGRVSTGMDIVYDISRVDTNDNDKPVVDVVINSITILQPSDVPILLSPGVKKQPGEYIDTTTPTFKWGGVSEADSYALYISKYPFGEKNLVFDSEVDYGVITGTNFELPDEIISEGYRYRWNMRAKIGTDWSDFSETLYFKTPGETSPDMTPKGFYYPTGNAPSIDPIYYYKLDPSYKDYSKGEEAVTYYPYNSGWLARGDKDHYQENKYHIAQDIKGEKNVDVYPISDGTIIKVHLDDTGWGLGNYGIFIKHTLAEGPKKEFIALYGHILPLEGETFEENQPVVAGKAFAKLGPFDGREHLHFGIIDDDEVPGTDIEGKEDPDKIGWGAIGINHWTTESESPETNHFTDPIKWIETKKPYSQSSNIDNTNGDSDSPGFELIFVILALSLVLFLKRKRKLLN